MKENKIKFENLTEEEQYEVDLENCAREINLAKDKFEQSIIEIGQWLTVAKGLVRHGEWENWLELNVGYTKMTASRYMKAYKLVGEVKDEISFKVQNLGGTKVIELSTLKVEQVEEIVTNNDIESISVRELKEIVKEYKQSNKKPKESKNNIDVTFETTTSPATITTEMIIKTDTNKIFTELCILNNDLRNRVGSDEDLETTLVAKYLAKEITHQEFIDVVAKNKLNLPIFFYKEALDDYLDRTDFYSDYEQYDNNKDIKQDRKYYSIFDKDFEWQEVISCNDESDEDMVDWSESNNIDNGTYQLTEAHNSYGDRYLCIYKDYKLLGSFQDGEWKDIDQLGTYDRRNIPTTAMKELETLYNKLEKQIKDYKERCTIRYAKQSKEREKVRKQQEKYEKILKEWKELYQPYSMGKWQFGDLWNEKGDIKNWTKYREMTDFVRAEKKKKQEQYSNYDFSGMFGGNSLAVKEEEKPLYKQFYRKLAMEFHPDKCKDDGHAMQIINDLKSSWGI